MRDNEIENDGTALAIRNPAAPVRMKLSDNLRSASRDEFVYVSRRGEVRPAWRFRAGRTATLTAAIGVGSAGVALCFAAGVPLLALIYLGTLGYIGVFWRHGARLKRGAALLAAEQLEEAEHEFRTLLSARTASKGLKALAWQNLASLDARRGNQASALEHVRACKRLLAKGWVSAGPWRWINLFSEALLLAQLGRVEEAIAARAGLADAPKGEYFEILRMNMELMLAFVRGDTRELPADLHDWLRVALDTTAAELALALLAWAHYARGDNDMGAHLLRQAYDRIDPRLFANVYPRVMQWLVETEPQVAREARVEPEP